MATAKISSVNGLVSDALKDNNISNEEFQLILAEREKYREHKNQIHRKVRTEVKEINNELKEQIREEAEKKGVERGKKEVIDNLLHTAQQGQGS